MKKQCFRRNQKTGEIISFHIPLKRLTPGECACAEEVLKGFARVAKNSDSYMDEMHDYWRWALGQLSADDLAGSRCSPKTTYAPPSKRKSKAEDQNSKLDKLRWLWFEEASEFQG